MDISTPVHPVATPLLEYEDEDDVVRTQVASDLTVLKWIQELQNETMIVIEDIIMSNALELVSHNKYAVAVRQDIARLQTQVTDDHDQIQQLNDALQRHVANTHHANYDHVGQSVTLSFESRVRNIRPIDL